MKLSKDNSIGEKLKECRQNCALSQQQVADALNMERSGYTKWENNISQPSLETLAKLAKIFSVDIKTLLPGEDILYAGLKDVGTESEEPLYLLSKEEQALIVKFRVLDRKEKLAVINKIDKLVKDKQ